MARAVGRTAAGGLLLLVLVLSPGCGRQEEDRLPAGTPVVFISIDTLRADRLPAYGYQGVETPVMDALRADSILLERAYTHVPLTLPAHASLLTGLLPADHGVRDNLGYRLETGEIPYLPRLLKERGYATGAAVSAFVLRAATGLASDFDFFDDRIEFRSGLQLGNLQRPGGETLDRALEWTRSVQDRPFFLFFHIYEPHSPYEPPEPFASRYPSPYDGEVAAADQIVGRLVATLKEWNLYDRSLMVLLSDHGEGLGDHGEEEHGLLLYREALHIPLLLKLPGSREAGASIAEPAALVDLLPTLAHLLGFDPPPGLPGIPLLDEGRRIMDRRIYSETFYPRLHFGWSDLGSLIDARHHYIEGPDPELYDLMEDPGETRNILHQERRVYAAMREELGGYDRTLQPPSETDPETRSRLAALGYVGAVAQVTEGPLPDPKSRLPVLQDLKEAGRLASLGDLAGAAEAYRAVLAREPRLVDAWEQLGNCLHKLSRLEEALEVQQRALELSGGAPHHALSVAQVLLDLNRLTEAKAHAELALPVHESAYDLLAQIALKEKDLEEAERQVERAVATRGTRIGPLITKAHLRLEQGRLQEALELTYAAQEEFGQRPDRDLLQGLYLIRGQAYAGLGEARRAEEAFLREIQLFPAQLDAYTHLAYLYAVEGRAKEAGATLRKMVEANPTPVAYAAAVRTLRAMGDPRSAEAVLRLARQRWPQAPELRGLGG